jgi:hypothetical protein
MISIDRQSITNDLVAGIRLILSVVFLYAAIMKGMDFPNFVTEMKKSPLLEPYDTLVVGIIVLVLEIITALLLAFKKTENFGLYFSFFIMLMFSIYLSLLFFTYQNPPCSCGGILGRMPYPVHIVFNITLTSLSLVAIILNRKFLFKDYKFMNRVLKNSNA